MRLEPWAVLISGNGSNLQAVMEEKNVSVVISSSAKAYGILRAKRAGVPVEVAETESGVLEIIRKYRVKSVFLAGYMKIVSENFIKQMTKAGVLLNIHPSLLPAYKGLKAFESAFSQNEKDYGVTVHHVVKEVDSGEFIKQIKFQLPSNRDFDSSKLLLHIHEQRVLRESLRRHQ